MTRTNSLIAPLLGLLAVSSAASAQQLFLDQQPSQQIALYASQGLESNADNFQVGPAGATLQTVRWWGSWENGIAPPGDTFNLSFHVDSNNQPGATVASFPGVTPTVVATGQAAPPLGAGIEYELTVQLPSAVQLGAGDYWLQLYSTNSSGAAERFTWEFAPEDPVNGLPCLAWSNQTPGVTWNVCTPFPETDLSLQLIGGPATLGASYCGPAVANSTGASGELTASGSDVASTNDVTLAASALPQSAFGFFLTSQTQGTVAQPGGSQGVLCLGGSIGRYVGPGQIQNSGTAGVMSLVLDLTQHPTPTGLVSVAAGETWSFQAWFRDSISGVATSNFTDGLEITFQ